MRARIHCIEDFISAVVEDTVNELFWDKEFTSEQVDGVEEVLLKIISHATLCYANSCTVPEEMLKRTANRMSKLRGNRIYVYDDNESMIRFLRAQEIKQEYEKQITARISLNPYIAQYERI